VEAVEDLAADTVLLQATSAGDREQDLCGELLAEPAPDTLVGVTTTETPARWCSTHLDQTTADPENAQLVCVGERTRSGARGAAESAPISTATVPDPGNLTKLGTLLSDPLTGDPSADAVLCLDSVTPLLHHSSRQTVFQFLHVLTDLVTANGVAAHYHLDPQAHDDETVASLKVLVDAVVKVSREAVEVETRGR